jgi:hypothetical protein
MNDILRNALKDIVFYSSYNFILKNANIGAITSVNDKTNEYFFRTCLTSSYPRLLHLSSTIYKRYIFCTLRSLHYFCKVGRIVSC